MKRIVDLVVGLSALVVLVVPIVMVAILVKLTSKGSMLYWSNRVGLKNKLFRMPKFRTMRSDTPQLATHLMNDPDEYLSPIGGILRRTSLDELPQLWNVLRGDMSLVGPRPNLLNQEELIRERDQRKVYSVRPGITGLAQVNEIDMSTPELLAETDARMIADMSVANYFKYILQTVSGKGSGDRVN